MEIKKLVTILKETLTYLQNSESSDYTQMPVEEIIRKLESEVTKAKNTESIDEKLINFLYAPTGAIQETAIDNGWGKEFLRISKIVDKSIDTK